MRRDSPQSDILESARFRIEEIHIYMYTYEGERRTGNKSGHTGTCMDQKVECREYEETQMEEGKKRESTKGACRKRDAHTQEDLCQRGGAAKGDEGGGVHGTGERRVQRRRGRT